MWNYIEKILSSFESSFSRERAYKWFVTIVIGLMIRSDALGFTSVIRDLCLLPKCYESMMHFFRASSWTLAGIQERWRTTVSEQFPVVHIAGRAILVGDGVKQSKEGRYMPGVKRLTQESETQTKPETIHGHMWGCVSILVGHPGNSSCLPLSMRIHDGLKVVHGWEHSLYKGMSHVVRMIHEGCNAAKSFGNCYYLMDRYFLSIPALRKLAEQNRENDGARVDIVTKAKVSAGAWELPEPRKPGQKGRPRIRGRKVKLMELFKSRKDSFKSKRMNLYGKRVLVRYMHIDLLWGKGLYQKLRFVLTEYGNTRSILVSTDLHLKPEAIIQLYARRFRIETGFRTFKQYIGGMAYHFWTKATPKLNHFRKKAESDPLSTVTSENRKKRIRMTVRATEMAVQMACIAMGTLQYLSIKFDMNLDASLLRYQRTPAKNRPSEDGMRVFLQRRILLLLEIYAKNKIPKLIRSLQCKNPGEIDKHIA